MKMEQTGLDKYVKLYSELQSQGLSEEVVIAMLQEVGKDSRVERMQAGNGQRAGNENGVRNGDMPATEKQLGYLKKLGVEVSAGLTKRQASELIDANAQVA